MTLPAALSAPSCYALVPCAGVGTRAGLAAPKQYHLLAGRAVVAHTLDALHATPGLKQTMVVLAPDDTQFEAAVPGFTGWVTRCGGATRAASVAAGLAALRERGVRDDDWVLVHDAARALIQPADVRALIETCQGDALGGLLAIPVADTLKRASGDARVAVDLGTIDRRDTWLAQTPQMFRLDLLQEALARADAAVTDEAGAVEALGHLPMLVRGPADNFKLTWPEDFARAQAVLRARADLGSPGEHDGDEVLALERTLLDPTRHADPQLADLLGPHFSEVDKLGVCHDRAHALAWLARADRPRYRMESVQRLGGVTTVLRYVAVCLAPDGTERTRSLRVSIWRRDADAWRLQGSWASPA